MAKKEEFTLDPKRMTRKWIQRRTDAELAALKDKWPSWCCRGRFIRRELSKRNGGRQ